MFERDKEARTGAERGLFREADSMRMTRYHVSGANDAAEIQAEREADRVTGSVFRSGPIGGGGVFRAEESAGGSGGEVSLPTSDLSGTGEALPSGLEDSMERSFGTSFAGVRVHNDAGADRASRSISARAFTRGQDVYFRDGEYAPDTQEGRHLIAHELAHVAAGDEGLHRMPTDEGEKEKVDAANNFSTEAAAEETYFSGIDIDDIKTNGTAELKLELWNHCNKLIRLQLQAESHLGAITSLDQNDQDVMQAKTNLETAKTNLDSRLDTVRNTLETLNSPQQGSDGDFSEPVAHMLKSNFCGQFFKAVEEVRGGAKGMDQDAVESAETSAINQVTESETSQVKGDIKISEASKNKDKIDTAANIATIASGVTDFMSEASDANEAAGNKKKSDKDYGTSTNVLGAISGTFRMGVDIMDTSVSMDMLGRKENREGKKLDVLKEKYKDTGIDKASSADHIARQDVAGKVINTLGDASGVASNIFGATGLDDASDVAGITGGALATVGDALGFAATTEKEEQQRKQDRRAKQSMRNIGKQLKATLANSSAASGQNVIDRKGLIETLCKRLENDSFSKTTQNSSDTMPDMIEKAMAEKVGSDDVKPDITPKQKQLLTSLKVLETSRQSSKEGAAAGRKDALLAGVGLLGDISALIGSVLKATDNSIAGSVMSMIGMVTGWVKSGIEAAGGGGGDKQAELNEERDKKLAACQGAIKAMAGLPALDYKALQQAKKDKKSVPAPAMEAAEQYAAVFDMIESANVEMVDILYAIGHGKFGEQNRSMEESIKGTYDHLTFSNMEV